MSDKKLTGKDLERLIENVLSEEGLPLGISSTTNKADIKKDLRLKDDSIDKEAYRSLVNRDGKDSDLSAEDVESVYNTDGNRAKKGFKAVDHILDAEKGTSEDDLRKAIKAIKDISPFIKAKNARQALADTASAYAPKGFDISGMDVNRIFTKDSSGKLSVNKSKNSRANISRAAELLKSTDQKEKEYLVAMSNDTTAVGSDASSDGTTGAVTGLDVLTRYAIAAKRKLDRNLDIEPILQKYNALKKSQLTAPKDRSGLERKTITSPEISTHGIESGKMLDSQFHMFEKMFEETSAGGGANNAGQILQQRIQYITDFTQDLSQAINEQEDQQDVGVQNDYLTFLNKTMILDYFNKMALELDSMSGAYTFEAFCAYLAGGISGGKITGLQGKMGATDFSFADGSKGSAKYLSSENKFSQAQGDFIPKSPVTYIFASKRGSGGTTVSDPGKIIEINMYVVTVERMDVGDKYLVNGEQQELKPTNGNISIVATSNDLVGILKLKTTDDKLITDNLENLAKKIDNDKGEFFRLFKETMADLLEAKDNIEIYANKGTTTNGDKASVKLKSAESKFGEFRASMTSPKKQITEQKITAEQLKKLIQESFK